MLTTMLSHPVHVLLVAMVLTRLVRLALTRAADHRPSMLGHRQAA
jgi:hypothetical protein